MELVLRPLPSVFAENGSMDAYWCLVNTCDVVCGTYPFREFGSPEISFNFRQGLKLVKFGAKWPKMTIIVQKMVCVPVIDLLPTLP